MLGRKEGLPEASAGEQERRQGWGRGEKAKDVALERRNRLLGMPAGKRSSKGKLKWDGA